MDLQNQPPPLTHQGSAASYYTSTSPVPVPGATVLTPTGPVPGLGTAPSSQVPRPPASTFDPPPLVHISPQLVQEPGPSGMGMATATATATAGGGLTQSPSPITSSKPDVKAARSGAEFALREYMTLQRRRYRTDETGPTADLESRIKAQAEVVNRDLGRLRREIAELAKEAEAHRWRRWLISGIIGTFIPAVRAIFRRPSDEKETSNDTEYAFFRSKSLVRRILDSVHGLGGVASMTFLVFAVMYVFQNEVSLRVARTVSKRLKRLSAKVEGAAEINERDMALLNGWRWRVLLWS